MRLQVGGTHLLRVPPDTHAREDGARYVRVYVICKHVDVTEDDLTGMHTPSALAGHARV